MKIVVFDLVRSDLRGFIAAGPALWSAPREVASPPMPGN